MKNKFVIEARKHESKKYLFETDDVEIDIPVFEKKLNDEGKEIKTSLMEILKDEKFSMKELSEEEAGYKKEIAAVTIHSIEEDKYKNLREKLKEGEK